MIGIYFPITQGKFALVDRELYQEVIQYSWNYEASGYARRSINDEGKTYTERLHQFVVFKSNPEGYAGNLDIDHENRDKLDCRRENLRLGKRGQNESNSPPRFGRKYKGVYRSRSGNNVYIKAKIKVDYKLLHLGIFDTEEDAALAYNVAAKKYFGEFAYQNEVASTKDLVE